MPERFEPCCHEPIAMIDAITGGNADQAADAMRLHLQQVRESTMAQIYDPF